MAPTDADDTVQEAHWFIEIRSIVVRLERALGAGEPSTVALGASDRVARGLSFGLNSRALAVGALLDVPEAAAGAYDCIRSMAEACAHLAWLHDGPHWHLEVFPRTTRLAGLELGAGVYIDSVAPEDAAAELSA